MTAPFEEKYHEKDVRTSKAVRTRDPHSMEKLGDAKRRQGSWAGLESIGALG